MYIPTLLSTSGKYSGKKMFTFYDSTFVAIKYTLLLNQLCVLLCFLKVVHDFKNAHWGEKYKIRIAAAKAALK